MNAKREQALVGLFVVVAVGLLAATIFLLTDTFSGTSASYHTYFKNAGGLGPGSEVRYAGGPPVGHVLKVQSDPQNPMRMEVDFAVQSTIPVKTDSTAIITSNSPLGDNFLGIVPGTLASAAAPPGSTIKSVEYVGFSDIVGLIGDLGPNATDLVKNLNDRTTELKVTLDRVNDLLDDQNRANISASLGNVRGMLEEDRPVVRSALNNVNDTTAKLGPLIDNFQKASVQANSALAHLDAAIGEDRPDIRQSVASLRQALGSAAQLTDQLNASVNTNSENLDEIIDNLRHVTENLNSLTETLKTRPYTLIRPSGIKPRNPGDKPPQ
jgi:phospholipid/cholesterol/gamma-HCH transport system substrate-binding protein